MVTICNDNVYTSNKILHVTHACNKLRKHKSSNLNNHIVYNLITRNNNTEQFLATLLQQYSDNIPSVTESPLFVYNKQLTNEYPLENGIQNGLRTRISIQSRLSSQL